MEKKHRRKIIVLKAAVSAAFFFILLSFVQHNELISVFNGVNWTFFILSFILAIVMLFVSCMKWKVLLQASGQQLDFIPLLRIYLIGYFFSNLLPSTIGGDVARSYYTGRLIGNQATAAAAVFLERFTGMLFLLILVVVAPLMQPGLYRNPFVYIPAIGGVLFLMIILWIWKVRDPFSHPIRSIQHLFAILHKWALRTDSNYSHRLIEWIENVFNAMLERLRKFGIELQSSLKEIRSRKRFFIPIAVLTAVFYFLTWANVYIAFLAFGVKPDFLSTCAIVPAIMFVGQIPLTLLGNLGFIESVFVVYFLQLEIPAAESLAMGLLLRLKILWLGIMGYFFYLSLPRDKNNSLMPTQERL